MEIETLSGTVFALALTVMAAIVVRSLLSFVSLFHVLSLILTSRTNTEKVFSNMTMNMKKICFTAVTLLMIALLVPTLAVQAGATSAQPSDQQVLTLRYDLVNAHATFVTGYMNDIVTLVPRASDLSAQVSAINSDMNSLNGYVSSNDNSGFNNYIKTTLTPEFQAAQAAIKNDRDQFKSWNVTNVTRKQLNTDYQNLKVQYESQVNSTNGQLYSLLLSDRISEYNAAIQKNDQVIANMSSKGYDVSGMTTVQGYGQAVVSKLQSVQGSDPTTIKNMLKSECLGNGATYSEHYYAEFDLARLQSISAKLAPIVASSNNTAAQQAFATANTDLSSVSSTLQTINHQAYSGNQQDQVWGDNGLKGASQNLKTVIDDLKSTKK